ncbi:MAG: TraR/DksA family transcriptional regulator [Minisyncoccia bacterium]
MEKKLLNELKKKLEAEKVLLEKDLLKFADKDKKIPYDYDTRFPEYDVASRPSSSDENASEIDSYDNLLAIEHALELRLKEVGEALEKINKNDDSYGKCEKCHKDIELERLKANPAAKLCLNCANNLSK